MFLSDKANIAYNMSIDGYVLNEKLSFEDKAMKPVVPILKDVDVHPYRWARLTVPVGFLYKPNKMSMPPGLGWFVHYLSIEKSLIMYDYLTWKIRSYKMNMNVRDEDETVSKAKQVADTLFLDMLSKESGLSGWKLSVTKFLMKNFSNSVLSLRDDDKTRMADAN
jgi:hypothetical protein